MANKRVDNPISVTHRLRDWIRRLINQTIDYFYPECNEEYVMSSREIRARQLLDEAINMTQPLSTALTHVRSGVHAQIDRRSHCALRRASNFEKNNLRQRHLCSKKVGPSDSL